MSSGNALTLRTLPALRASRMKASNREMPTLLERSTAEQSTTSSAAWLARISRPPYSRNAGPLL